MNKRVANRIIVVCSDEARNGKTLTARLFTESLLMNGSDPFVFDCDEPRGRIGKFYPDRSSHVDVEKTSGQMRMFDTVLAEPSRDYIVDLPAHGLDPFFTVIDNLDFINAAHDAGTELVIAFVLDQTATSVMTARDLRGAFSTESFYLIRNAWNASPLTTRQAREVYEEIEPDAVFRLPLVDREAMAVAEEAPFSFARFSEGKYPGMSPIIRLRLRSFLSEVMSQFSSEDLKLDLGSLKQMGLI